MIACPRLVCAWLFDHSCACRTYHYWALAHPVVGPPLSGTGHVQADGAP